MSNQDYNAKLKEITALSDEDVKQPNMPIGEAVQEAENLVAWCQDDKAALIRQDWIGPSSMTFRDEPAHAAMHRACGSGIPKPVKKQKRNGKQNRRQHTNSGTSWCMITPLHIGRHPELIAKVQTIREGGSRADMLQDLSDLEVLSKANADLLKGIGFDMKKLAQAAALSDELSAVLALANGEDGNDDNAKEMRDKAYTFMKQAIDDIHTTGQYVFWRDEDRRKGYVSAYFRKKNQGKAPDKPSEE